MIPLVLSSQSTGTGDWVGGGGALEKETWGGGGGGFGWGGWILRMILKGHDETMIHSEVDVV